jgi:hypothetical protein
LNVEELKAMMLGKKVPCAVCGEPATHGHARRIVRDLPVKQDDDGLWWATCRCPDGYVFTCETHDGKPEEVISPELKAWAVGNGVPMTGA